MKLSEQLRQDHECGDFGQALEGYAERAEALEAELSSEKRERQYDLDASVELNKLYEREVKENAELRREVERLRRAGQPLSNQAFNLSQANVLPQHIKKSLAESYAKWDEATKGE